MTFKVQQRLCESCIYKPDSPLDLKRLEAEITDKNMPGFFTGFRECHHATRNSGVCCRGFWNAHKDSFTAGQLAQRLGLVEFVMVDALKKTTGRLRYQRRLRKKQREATSENHAA